MGRMIPPFYDDTVTSDGEKKLFRVLEKLDDKYVILHSLGLAEHLDKVFGEIDFVIVCEEGILCLEVKGGFVTRENGVWYFIDRYGRENKKPQGPFDQAIRSMYSLRNHMKKHFGAGAPVVKCQYACGVVFPDIPFTLKGPDIIPEIIFDSRRTPEDIETYIHSVFAYWKNKMKEKHGFAGNTLSRAEVERVAAFLRGDFGFIPSLGYIIEQTDRNLLSLTREQAERLSMAAENPRILLKGAAGTGKTLLSIEYARRCVLKGKRVLFLCFNRNLRNYLRMQLKNQDITDGNSLQIETLHSYLTKCLKGKECLPSQDGMTLEYYYQFILPAAFADMASRGEYEAEHDVLVIDEGQDLLRLEYIMCMDIFVKGGLKEGNWHICYDPNQNIYNPEFEEGLKEISQYSPVLLQLDTNCRNTFQIGVYNSLATGIPPAKYLKVRGEDVIRQGYADHDEERVLVRDTVRKLISQGVKPGKICLLSKYRFENSCLHGENIFEGICSFQNITDLNPAHMVEESIKFCTIQGFKGLEAPVVVLLDVDSFADEKSRQLNYTAISRATSVLIIFYRRDLDREWEQMVRDSAHLLENICT